MELEDPSEVTKSVAWIKRGFEDVELEPTGDVPEYQPKKPTVAPADSNSFSDRQRKGIIIFGLLCIFFALLWLIYRVFNTP
jgi:hypothetical protein